MNVRHFFLKIVAFLSLLLFLSGVVQISQPVWASTEDAAIFYEELDKHGDWVEYKHYGAVWYPTQVKENWRPYVDGRWTPTEEGYVFETQEPWGWATYHYGNWMPTGDYGWVWVPGRTWYPNTVTWRTSPESESPDESYIGWAPIPPPNYSPEPGYYPEGYYGGGPYRGPGAKLVTVPFWIFVRAVNFLFGFSEPYSPAYSYWGCHCLVPPTMLPYYCYRTAIVHNYYAPQYYPRGYIGAGWGYYNWGPPIPYVARVTRIKQVTINNYVRQVNIYQRRNVAPPPEVLARRTYFQNVVPPAMVSQHRLPPGMPVGDIQAARTNLAQPDLVKANIIKNAPTIPANIPKTQVTTGESGQGRRGVPGSALPASAMMQPDQKLEKQFQKIPSSQRIEPVSPRARKWQVPQTPGSTASQPTDIQRRQGLEPAPATSVAPSTTTSGAIPAKMRSGPQGTTPQAGTPGVSGAPQEAVGRGRETPTPGGMTTKAPSPSQTGVPQERYKPGKYQSGTRSQRKEPPQAAVIPGQPPGQGQKPSYTPGTIPSGTTAPVQVQPQPRPPVQQPQPQQQPKRQPRQYTPDQSQSLGPVGPKMTGTQPRYQQHQSPPPRQVYQQPVAQPMPQVRQQPPPPPQRQVHQLIQPRPQAPPQAQPRPQPQQKQHQKKEEQKQN